MDTNNAILDVLLAFGWKRHGEICDVTPAEVEEMENHGTFTRDGRNVFGIGQTDTSGDTYAFQDPSDDGNILIAPYEAGTVWPDDPEEARRQHTLRTLAGSAFGDVPDNYCQSIAFRLRLKQSMARQPNASSNTRLSRPASEPGARAPQLRPPREAEEV